MTCPQHPYLRIPKICYIEFIEATGDEPMNAKDTLAAIRANPSGPVRKFQLMKAFGPALRQAGYKPETMDCTAIEAIVEKLLPRLKNGSK
jgi:hypothetical protein